MSRRWGVRSVASLLIFLLAALLTPSAIVGHWGHRTVTDAEQYIATVGPLASDPIIQQAVGAEVTKVLVEKIDTTALVDSFLGNFVKNPTINERLSGPIAAGVNGLIGQAVDRVLASPAFETVWITANTAAQKSLMYLLEGNPQGIIQRNGDQIVLDTTSLLKEVQTQIVASGLSIAANVTIPETGNQVVLFETPLIGQIQTIYSFTSPILKWFPLIVAALFALSIALARRRPRVVLTLGIVLTITAIIMLLSLSSAETLAEGKLNAQGLGLALIAFWTTFFSYLVGGLQALLLLGVVAIVAGWFAGRSSYAGILRDQVCDGLHELGEVIPVGLNTFVRSYSLFLRWAVALVLVFILTAFGTMSVVRVFWLVALGVLFFAAIEACNRPDRELYAEASLNEVTI
ncbi:MAG: hypothetical protein F2806_06120 [Actinobacteria bacterium]|uniref:Unannotated protein n=1 Tax=freshwater metagenome TaxID=449393 RepID=A0A6J7GDJ1_9ZZZZ|nr:hypothetical protein [Actinomycetota bacterium]